MSTPTPDPTAARTVADWLEIIRGKSPIEKGSNMEEESLVRLALDTEALYLDDLGRHDEAAAVRARIYVPPERRRPAEPASSDQRWGFTRRREAALAAWYQYIETARPGSVELMPTHFETGFTMGVAARQNAPVTDFPDLGSAADRADAWDEGFRAYAEWWEIHHWQAADVPNPYRALPADRQEP